MLYVTIPSNEMWDENKQEFVYTKEQRLQLEHSLVSISKWESKWHKPFLATSEKGFTPEETIDYIRCMTLTQNISPDVYYGVTSEIMDKVLDYINNPMTATTFSDNKQGRPNREIVTAELIYHWMIALQIPAEYRKWHLNRLLTLIRVCEIKNNPPKPMGRQELLSRNRALNAARRKSMNTKG